jgi:hypothetical protein
MSVTCRACLSGLIVLFWSVGIERVSAQQSVATAQLAPKGEPHVHMTADDLRTAISLLSAAISLASLFVVLRTRKETVKELFEEKKDEIARQMTENEELATGRQWKAELLAERLRALPSGAIPEDRNATICAELEGVGQFYSKYLNERMFTADQIRSITYSRENVQNVRTIALSEYNITKRFNNEAWAAIIATAEATLEGATKEK